MIDHEWITNGFAQYNPSESWLSNGMGDAVMCWSRRQTVQKIQRWQYIIYLHIEKPSLVETLYIWSVFFSFSDAPFINSTKCFVMVWVSLQIEYPKIYCLVIAPFKWHIEGVLWLFIPSCYSTLRIDGTDSWAAPSMWQAKCRVYLWLNSNVQTGCATHVFARLHPISPNSFPQNEAAFGGIGGTERWRNSHKNLPIFRLRMPTWWHKSHSYLPTSRKTDLTKRCHIDGASKKLCFVGSCWF